MIVIAAGGTGGHFFPALSLIEFLREKGHQACLMGVFDKDPRLLPKASCEVVSVPGSPLSWRGCPLITRGIQTAYRELQSRKARYVVCFGGYGSFPVIAAAKLLGIPYFICELDCYPSLVNRLFSRGALARFCYFESAQEKLAGEIYPIKPLFKEEKVESVVRDILLISGGSQGALTLNRAVIEILPSLKKLLQGHRVVHTIGWKEDREQIERAYREAGIEATVSPFIEDMASIYARSSMAICRAGSGTLHELARHQVPAVIIPHVDQKTHQHEQAAFFADCMGGGKWVASYAPATRLVEAVCDVFTHQEKYRNNLLRYEAKIEGRKPVIEALLEMMG